MYAMSAEGTLPAIFSKQDKKTDVLVFSLTIFAAVCIVILFFAQTFEKILNFTIFLDCFGMVASSAAIFKLRSKTKHLDGTGIFKMKLFPLIPLFFIVGSLYAPLFYDRPVPKNPFPNREIANFTLHNT
jgi:APA family basic amino acid/polyamine antiporter